MSPQQVFAITAALPLAVALIALQLDEKRVPRLAATSSPLGEFVRLTEGQVAARQLLAHNLSLCCESEVRASKCAPMSAAHSTQCGAASALLQVAAMLGWPCRWTPGAQKIW